MQVLFVVLKKVELADELIRALAKAGVTGGTVMESTGMANALADQEELPVFGILRKVLSDEEQTGSKTLMFVLREEELTSACAVVRKVAGDFNQPNTGIMFAVPVTFAEGIGKSTCESEDSFQKM